MYRLSAMVAHANNRIMIILPAAPRPEAGMPLMPISPPSQRLLAHEAGEQEIHADRGHGEKIAAHPQRGKADHDTEQRRRPPPH